MHAGSAEDARDLPCNTFTWCGERTCFEPDIHSHTLHDCRLKFSEAPIAPEVPPGSRRRAWRCTVPRPYPGCASGGTSLAWWWRVQADGDCDMLQQPPRRAGCACQGPREPAWLTELLSACQQRP